MILHQVAGLVGAALIIGAYLLLQLDRVRADQPSYSIVNALGAGLILVSLAYDFNLSAAVIEVFWLIVSLLGLIRRRHTPRSD